MGKGLNIWLSISAISSIFIMISNLDTASYTIFSWEQLMCNTLLFTPACCIMCISVLFQLLQNSLEKVVVPLMVSIIIYFIILCALLPYRILSCLLLGIVMLPIGALHYLISIKFFNHKDYAN